MSFLTGLFSGSKGSDYQAMGPQEQEAEQAGQTANNAMNMLQGVATGTSGPNPGQALLNQATGQNIANATGLIKSQKGLNPGIAARLAGQQAANIQQQSAGQAATMRANQQQAAMDELNRAAQSEQGLLLGSIANQNNANASIAQQNANAQNQMGGNLLGNLPLIGKLFAGGGEVKKFAGGGPSSAIGQFFYPSEQEVEFASGPRGAITVPDVVPDKPSVPGLSTATGGQGAAQGITGLIGTLGKAAPAAAAAMAKGGRIKRPVVGEELAAKGEKVPGKAKVKGNSYANDIIDAKLSPGEIILPRSVTMSEDPVKNAAKFVQAVLAKQHMKRK